jgi:hypothetical protein
MPFVQFQEDELVALCAVLNTADRARRNLDPEPINWHAYDRAKHRIREKGRQWIMLQTIVQGAREMDIGATQADTKQQVAGDHEQAQEAGFGAAVDLPRQGRG